MPVSSPILPLTSEELEALERRAGMMPEGEILFKTEISRLLVTIRQEQKEHAFYKQGWNGAVELCRQIAERCGCDTTQEPPEGLLTTLHVVEDYVGKLEATIRQMEQDSTRLDWVLQNSHCTYDVDDTRAGFKRTIIESFDSREAIDAALSVPGASNDS